MPAIPEAAEATELLMLAPELRRLVPRRLRAVPRTRRPYLVPGLPTLLRLRWAWRLWRTPAIAVEEHVAGLKLRKIELPLACHLCGERRVQPLFVTHGPKGRRKRGYYVVRCPGCGLLYRNPGIKPERLADLYAKQYSRFLTGHYGGKRERRYELAMDAFTPLLDEGAGRRLLDFGCGVGIFLELAARRGFDPYGVDLSSDSIEVARRRPSGAHAYAGAPEDVPEIAAGGFDVVTLWSVLAHLAAPVDDLRRLRSLVADDGVLVILTVNANSLQLRAFGERWNGFTPNHLAFFAPDTLARLVSAAGFGALVTRPAYGDAVEGGGTRLAPLLERRLRRAVDAGGNQGNMIRAVAFADADGPARWGLKPR